MGAPYQPQDPYGQTPPGGYQAQQPGMPGGQQPFRPSMPIPAMNSVPQASTVRGKLRPPVELILAVAVWAAFGLFNAVMSIVYFVNEADWAARDAADEAQNSLLSSGNSAAMVNSAQTGYTVRAFLFLGVAVVVLVLAVITARGMNGGRLALPLIGLVIILLTTASSDPFHPEWIIAAVAVLCSVLLFLPRSNAYVATMGQYG